MTPRRSRGRPATTVSAAGLRCWRRCARINGSRQCQEPRLQPPHWRKLRPRTMRLRRLHRRQTTQDRGASTKANSPSPNPNVSATRHTLSSLPRNPVSFAGGNHPILIICALPSRRAIGMKVSDEFTVPLCRGHHRELHRYGDERVWWKKQRLEPMGVALKLWRQSHPLPAVPQPADSNGSAPAAPNDPQR